MGDDQDLQDLKSDIADRAAGVIAGIIIAVVGAIAVVGLTMDYGYYGVRFGNLTTAGPNTPAITQTAPAPRPVAPSGTVGQAPQSPLQNPAPANTSR